MSFAAWLRALVDVRRVPKPAPAAAPQPQSTPLAPVPAVLAAFNSLRPPPAPAPSPGVTAWPGTPLADFTLSDPERVLKDAAGRVIAIAGVGRLAVTPQGGAI